MFKMHLLLIKQFKYFSHFNFIIPYAPTSLMLNYLWLNHECQLKNAGVGELLALTI